MQTINVDGLPEPIARALEAFAQMLRAEFIAQQETRPRVQLPVWPGNVIGELTREEIYKDVG